MDRNSGLCGLGRALVTSQTQLLVELQARVPRHPARDHHIKQRQGQKFSLRGQSDQAPVPAGGTHAGRRSVGT